MVATGGLAAVLDGEYEILGELGRGAMGVVLRARHRRLDRLVAIKELPPSFAADDDVRRRFLDEAQTLAKLDHPHVVVIHDFVDREGHLALVMEQLPGGTVWDRFVDEGVTPARAVALMLSTAAGLQHAHDRGVLHRDVKPENLMFAADGQLKVTDFGIAEVLTGEETLATADGQILGTPAYMSPEQAEGGELGPQADVYACGVMLYEMLTGSLPQGGSTSQELLDQRVSSDPPPLSGAAPHLPRPITDVVDRAISRRTGERWPTAEAMAVALGGAAADAWGPAWLDQVGVSVRGGETIERAARTTSNPVHTAPAEPSDARVTGDSGQLGTATVTDGMTPADGPAGARATVTGDAPDAAAQETVDAPDEPQRSEAPPAMRETVDKAPAVDAPDVPPAFDMAAQAPVVAAQRHREPVVDLRNVVPSEMIRIRDVSTTPNPLPFAIATIVAILIAVGIMNSGLGGWPAAEGDVDLGTPHETIDDVRSVDFSQTIEVGGVPAGSDIVLSPRLLGVIPLGSAEATASGQGTATFEPGLLQWTTAGPLSADVSRSGADEPIATVPVDPTNPFWATAPFAAAVLIGLFGFASIQSNLRTLRRGSVRVGAYAGLAISGALFGAAATLLAMAADVSTAGSLATVVAAAIALAVGAVLRGEWQRRSGLRRRLRKLKRAGARA